MKFSELSTGTVFSLVPNDDNKYIKLWPSLTTGYSWNTKSVSEPPIYSNFPPDQEVEILNNFKRDPLKEL